MEHIKTHPNGSLHSIGNTINGNRHGVWNYYFPNGYFHRQEFYKMGKLDGNVKEYNMKFNVVSTFLYKDGEPIQ